MLKKWKAPCNCNLRNLIGSQQSLKKTAALVLTMILLLNALPLTIQYTHQHARRCLGHLLSEGRGLGVESAIGGSNDRDWKKETWCDAVNGQWTWGLGHDILLDESLGTYKQTSRGKANVPPHENSRDDISGDTKTKRDQSSTTSSQVHLFLCEDGRSNQGERGQNLMAQSLFQTFSEWQLCYIQSYLFFHYPTYHTLLWVPYHYLI